MKYLVIIFLVLVQINVFSQTANAGADQAICAKNTVLQGNDPSPNTGIWTVIEGNANITDNTLYNTTLTNISDSLVKLEWAVTDGVTTVYDTVSIYLDTANAGVDFDINTSSAQLHAVKITNFSYIWNIIESTGTLDGAETDPQATVNFMNIGFQKFEWQVTSNLNGCYITDTVTITRNPNAGNDISTSQENAQLSGEEDPEGAVGEWTVMYGTGTFDNQNSGNAIISGLQLGITTLRWTITKNGHDFLDEMQINRTTGIETIGVDEFTIYPNPASSILNINIPNLQSFTIIDVSGKIVFNSTNKNLNRIDLSKYQTGVYIIKIKTNNTVFNTRLLVK